MVTVIANIVMAVVGLLLALIFTFNLSVTITNKGDLQLKFDLLINLLQEILEREKNETKTI